MSYKENKHLMELVDSVEEGYQVLILLSEKENETGSVYNISVREFHSFLEIENQFGLSYEEAIKFIESYR